KQEREGGRFGLALDVGEVLYGNRGGETRLVFTGMGAVVNLAAGLEKLASKWGRTILASDKFARHCRGDFQPIGKFALAGFAAQQTVFGVADEANDTVSMS